jgi:hypothetical protein
MNTLTIIPDKRLTLDQLDQWEIPAETTKEQWTEGHTQLLWYAYAVKRLLPKSEAFGRAQFGDEHWIETEARFQLEFGLPIPDSSTPRETDEDRVLAYLCKGVERWMERSGNLDTWDSDRLNAALNLLEPMEKEAQRIRELLEAAK